MFASFTFPFTLLTHSTHTQRLMVGGSAAAALLNLTLLIPGLTFGWALLGRALTGASMALVYPMACKVTATWTTPKTRGVAMGLVVGSVSRSMSQN